MEIKKIIMVNGNEYEVLWDLDLAEEGFYKMIDLTKGWVKLNINSISEIFEIELLKERKGINSKVKKEIIKQYGDFYFN